MNPETSIYLTIGLSALVTYAIRFGGLILADRLPDSGRPAAFLEALPGTILISFIAPELLRNGSAGIAAGLLIAGLMLKTKNVLLASAAGILLIFLVRNFLL